MSGRILSVDDLKRGNRYDFRYNNENCTACKLDIVTPGNLIFSQPHYSDDEDESGIEWELVVPMAEANNINFYVTADGDTDVESPFASQVSQGGRLKTKKSKK
jgi:hypothetical protein